MKTTYFRLLCCVCAAAALAGCGDRKAEKAAQDAARQKEMRDSTWKAEYEKKSKDADKLIPLLPEEPVFDINTSLGTIKVKLYSKTPGHRANFERLALSGYYDGLLFHRVIDGFMIQGGDPYTRDSSLVAKYGQGGPGYTIPAEIVPDYSHKKGALAAARRGDAANPERESSGSQFYLVQSPEACAQLDGQYTVFGETVEGLDVIDKIASVETDARDLPVNPVKIISITLDESSRPAAADGTAVK